MKNSERSLYYGKLENDVFRYIAYNDTILTLHSCPISSIMIAKKFGITLYKARKVVAMLKAEGLVESAIEIFSADDDDWKATIFKGYRTTAKGRQTEIFKEEARKMEKEVVDCFGDFMKGYAKSFD